MKEFIRNIKEAWGVEELRKRILTTLSLILIYRIGSFVVIPGIDTMKMQAALGSSGGEGVFGLIDIFAGGAFNRASIFALGIMPYISASIIMQLGGMVIPAIKKMQREGESGRKKVNNYTRFLTILICVFQGPSFLGGYVPSEAIVNDTPFWWITAVSILIAGTMFVVWLGERITENGLGNGVSLLIMVGIIARLPIAIFQEFISNELIFVVLHMALFAVIVGVTVMLVMGVRRVPLEYTKQLANSSRHRFVEGGAKRSYFPIKVNSAGVMPIIFAQAIMFVPGLLAKTFPSLASLSDYRSFGYNAIFAVLIIVFTYLYTALTFNPKDIADDFKRNGAFIPGVKPGEPTASYIDKLFSRITFPGSVFLALIAVLPALVGFLKVDQSFAVFFGGTSLLIAVGVILDTIDQANVYLKNKEYDSLMSTGGRTQRSKSLTNIS